MTVKGWKHALMRKRVVAAMAAIGLVSVGTGLALNMPSAQGATPAVQVTAGIASRSVTKRLVIFFTNTITVNYAKGHFKLAGTSTGKGPMLVDDAIIVTVTRPDGTVVIWNHDFDKGPCTPATPLKPMDLSAMLQPGNNKIQIQLQDLCGGSEGSSALWLH
jgi:hypothetical protein